MRTYLSIFLLMLAGFAQAQVTTFPSNVTVKSLTVSGGPPTIGQVLTSTGTNGSLAYSNAASGSATVGGSSSQVLIYSNSMAQGYAGFIYNPTNGNVGIGTIAPVNKLDVEGAVAIGAAYSGTSTAPTDGFIVVGNVGIGTPAPLFQLDVLSGTANTGANVDNPSQFSVTGPNKTLTGGGATIFLNGNSAQASDTGASIAFSGRTTDASTSSHIWATLKGAKENSTSGNEHGYLDIAVRNNDSGALVERLRINSIGNVGIGTVTPGAKLHIEGGDFYIGGSNRIAFSNGIAFAVSPTNNSIFFWNTNGTVPALIFADGVSSGAGFQSGGGAFIDAVTIDSNVVNLATIRMRAIKLTNGAVNGHVLTSDANGLAAWAAPSGGGGEVTTAQLNTASNAVVTYANGVTNSTIVRQPDLTAASNAVLAIANNKIANNNGLGTNTTLWGSIGIGTLTPGSRLSVSNAVGSTGTPIAHFGTNNTGNGLIVDTNGNVAIGSRVPSAQLDVPGEGRFGSLIATNATFTNLNVTTLNVNNINLTNALGSNQVRLAITNLTDVSVPGRVEGDTLLWNPTMFKYTNGQSPGGFSVSGNSNQIPYLNVAGTGFLFNSHDKSAPGFGFQRSANGNIGAMLIHVDKDEDIGLVQIGPPNPASNISGFVPSLSITNRYAGDGQTTQEMVRVNFVDVDSGSSAESFIQTWRSWVSGTPPASTLVSYAAALRKDGQLMVAHGTFYPSNSLAATMPTAAQLGLGGIWTGNSNGSYVAITCINGSTTAMKVLAP